MEENKILQILILGNDLRKLEYGLTHLGVDKIVIIRPRGKKYTLSNKKNKESKKTYFRH